MACLQVTHPTIKIALVAPFEGRYRDVGYEVIYAVRLAVREANEAGGVAGYTVDLLALDDGGEAEQARTQAEKIGVDPQVLAVIGHWLEASTLAGAPLYADLGIPMLATSPSPALAEAAFRLWPTQGELERASFGANVMLCPAACDSLENLDWLGDLRQKSPEARIFGPSLWGFRPFPLLAGDASEGVYFVAPAPYPADSSDPGFAERYRAISIDVEPAAYAVLAYDAASVLLDAVARDMQSNGEPTRAGVAAALEATDYPGLSGKISFDSQRNWEEAMGWVYQWRDGAVVRP